ncbi:hypothetical protein ABPG72_011452 [Tetrahymena utriculariae]
MIQQTIQFQRPIEFQQSDLKSHKILKLAFKLQKINSNDAGILANQLQDCQNLQCLDLDLMANDIGAQGAQDLGKALGSLQMLNTLIINLQSLQQPQSNNSTIFCLVQKICKYFQE